MKSTLGSSATRSCWTSSGGAEPGAPRVYVAGNSDMVANVVRSLGGRGFRVSTEAVD